MQSSSSPHLRWDFVYQRPQHLLSRLAAGRRVIFIEEPDPNVSNRPEWALREAAPNILVAMPRTPSSARGFHSEQTQYLKPLLRQLLAKEGVTDYVVWFYTAMAAPLAAELKPLAVVYDCMDELSAFLPARRAQLIEREKSDLLAKWPILVFTGGPSLYRAKKDRHPRRPLLLEQRGRASTSRPPPTA